MRFILITIISFLFCIRLSAQVYPVQATAQLIPPFTPYLSDYTKVGAQKFMLQIRLNDPIATSYPVKLRLTIEGVGITLRTKSSIFLNPITLQGGGIPQLLYGEDLEEYFRSANLDFSGLSRAQYEKNASLPEGVYRFTIEVLDYNRNTVVSNKATTTAWMMLNDPPMLNLPARETKIQLINPTNIPFTWTPRHTGSPNAAFTTEYTFRLVEMASGTPSSLAQNAIQSQPTLYELTTNQTQIVYGMAEPALIPGRKYAWQVQAKDTDGRDLFKNDGRSEVYVFEFGDALGVPENMYLQSANASALTIRWEQNTLSSEQNFRLSYRPHQNRNTEQWYELQTAEQWKAITQLKPDTDYEVKVRSEQGTLLGEYNPIQIYRTVPLGANEFVCRSDVPPLSIPSVVFPIFGLSINDTIRAGGYDVLVRHVSGSNGAFYGDGVAIVPWFNSSKVRVTFENISVNSQFYLTAGVIKSVWDADGQFLLKVPPADSVAKPGSTPTAGDIPITIAATDSLIKISGAAIAAVTKDDEGNIVISTTDGNQQVLEKGKSYSVADDIGNGYIIDKDGNIAKTTAKAALAAAERGNRTYNIALKFQKGNGEYGFDELPQDAAKDILASYYQAMDDGNRISWKVLADGKRDVVNAATESTDLDLKKISFELNGVPIKSTRTDKIELDLIGQGDGVSNELLAKYEGSDEVIGKLNVIHYKEITRTLVLVPVNDRQLKYVSSLQTALNTIYKQAAVTWNVITDHGIQVSLDETFDDTADEIFSNYTDDMKKVINAYTKDHTLAPDTYYLFLVDKPKSITKAGQLPRKKQAGFLFVDNLTSPELTIKTVAHELGHGAFRLEHTFKQFPSLTKESTNNLMDYRPDGTYLYKYQWDYIHDPEAMLGLFEDDEDGALKNYSKYVTSVIRKIRSAYSKSNELVLAPPDNKKTFTGRFTLENGQVYDLTIAFQNSEPINSEIKGFQGVDPEYYTALSNTPQKAITLYNSPYYSQSNTLINIIFTRFGFEDDKQYDIRTKKDIKSLADYLFWKPIDGNNLTVFVSGFDLIKHSDLLECKGMATVLDFKLVPNQLLWEKLKLAYVAFNDRPFIADLKETILPKECQNIDSFTSNFTILEADVDNYWSGIDLQFMYATGNSGAVYAQGDNSIRTAMDDEGFEIRVRDGRRAAEDMIQKIKGGIIKLREGSKIDVVSHSMGFAYAQGMIDGLQHAGYKIGWIYAVAPENPGAGKVPKNIEGMWQYGSQETDPFYSQDGIAPQVAIPGINQISNGGRVPIDPIAKQDFFNSHTISNYTWITGLKKNDIGYVKSRK